MRGLKYRVVAGIGAVFAVVALANQGQAHTGTTCSALGSWDKTFKVNMVGPTPWTILEHDEHNSSQQVIVRALMYQLEGHDPSIPGPTLDVTEGDHVCVEFTNNMDEHTSVHFHGIKAPFLANDTDGVPPVGAGVDIPNDGSPRAVHFTAPKPGAFMYHAHENTTRQILLGLYGRIIVKSKHHRDDDQYAYDDTWMLSEWRVNKRLDNTIINDEPAGLDVDSLPNYFIINGKAFDPAALGDGSFGMDVGNKIVILKPGQKARIRLIGMGQWTHPMHMHGRNFKVIAKDGTKLKSQETMNTLAVHPGEIWDIEFTAGTTPEDLGIWVFHCHVLDHATNNDVYPGGLVSAVAIVP